MKTDKVQDLASISIICSDAGNGFSETKAVAKTMLSYVCQKVLNIR